MNFSQKNTLPLLFLLALCLMLSACDLSEPGFEAQSKNELAPSNTENTTAMPEMILPTDTSADTDIENISETEVPTSPEDAQSTEAQTQLPDEFEASGLSKYLILEITDYLDNYLTQYSMTDTSFAIKLYNIKRHCLQPLYVRFDKESYYYACAYFNPAHEYGEASYPYCCTREYTWIKFEKPVQITDTFDGMKLVCAFQVNRSEFCHDIGSTVGLSDNIEHYSPYVPEFVEGVNIAPSVKFEKSFIYLNETNHETVYCTVERPYHDWIAMPCIAYEGHGYVSYYLSVMNADGSGEQIDFKQHFGEYSDHVMGVMIKDLYKVPDQFGGTYYYGLIPVEEVAKMILE